MTISILTGDNGILQQAGSAVLRNKKAKAKEEISLACARAEAEYQYKGKSKEDFFDSNIEDFIQKETGATISMFKNRKDKLYCITYTLPQQGEEYYYTVDLNGNIIEVDGFTIEEYAEYTIKTPVTVKGETYYVIKNSDKTEDSVLLFRAEPLAAEPYGTTTDYRTSNVRSIIDAWANSTFSDDELKEVDGYKARIITKEEYENIPVAKNWAYNPSWWHWTMTPYDSSTTSVYGIHYDGYPYERPINKNTGRGKAYPVINLYKWVISD